MATIVNAKEIEDAIAELLKERFSCKAQVNIDSSGLSDRSARLQGEAWEIGLKSATSKDEVDRVAQQWKDSKCPVAEEGGSVAQLIAEEADRQANRHILQKMKGNPHNPEAMKIMDGIQVQNATTQ